VKRFDDAVALHEQADSLGLELPADLFYAMALLFSGHAEAALAEYRRDGLGEPTQLAGSAMAFYALGQRPEYEQVLNDLEALMSAQPQAIVWLAAVYAFIGDIDRAFAILNGAPQLPPLMFSDPQFDALREHPRYEELLAKTGIWPDDPREKIRFDFTLPQ